MKTFPTLYKKTATGATQQWTIFTEDNKYWTQAGQVDGAMIESKPTVCSGKNLGKSNESSDEQQAILEAEAIIKKKLETGYTENIENIDTCYTYVKPQLAHKYIEYKDSVVWPCLASIKIDGMRMINVKGATTSRNGKPIVSCPHIGKALIPFFEKYPINGMVDGEIFCNNEYFETIMSIVKKTKPTVDDLIESEKKAKLWVFDGITDNPKERFDKRFLDIKQAIKETVSSENLKYFVFVENVVVNNHEEFMAEHDKYVAKGFEGVMLRYANAPYENKRSKLLLKYKNFIDDELIIDDILEGSGNDAGMASKIVVKLKNGGTSEAGIKGTNEYTVQLLKDKNKYIGKLATVRYQGFTKEGKLRFGVVHAIDPFDR
jgi:DNA ligase 1